MALIERIDTVKDFLLVLGKKSLVYTDEDFSQENVALYERLATCSQQEFAETIRELGPNAPIDHVRIEIGRALHRGKDLHIIPVVPESTWEFSFSKLKLPPDIAGIKNYEAVFYSDNPDTLFKDVVPRIRNRLLSRPDKPIAKMVGIVAAVVLCFAVIVGSIFGKSWMDDNEAFGQCRTYADYYQYMQDGHRFHNAECETMIKEFYCCPLKLE